MKHSFLYQLALWTFGISIGTALLEGVIRTFILKLSYDWKAASSSLFIILGRIVIDSVPLAFAFPGIYWFYQHRIFQIPLESPWAWLVLFLSLEFSYYWFHRASHRMRWLWCTHSVHHSSTEFNLSTNYRVGWTAKLTFTMLFFSPIALLGYPPHFISTGFVVVLLGQFWIHTTWIPKLGPLEWILNTPSAHRVHHAANDLYLDKNYGGLLIIFDRLFGTYQKELSDTPPRYGWVKPLQTQNPFRLQLHPWAELFKDLKGSRSIKELWLCIFGPPEWQPARRKNIT